MKVKKTENQIFIKFDKGEELVSSLNKFLKKENIQAGSFTAIGAIKNPVLGYFNTETLSYEKKEIKSDYELVSLIGNIGITKNLELKNHLKQNSEITTHIHVSLADNNFNLIGGHLFSAEISVTVEMFVNIFSVSLERIYDNKTKLNLLSPKP